MGRILGIPVLVRRGWLAVATVLTWAFEPVAAEAVPGLGHGAYAVSAAFAVLLYVSVLVHELGHSLLARHLGFPVERIELGPLGGGSLLGREVPTPGREAAIAAIGPVCSLVLGGLGLVLAAVSPDQSVLRALAVELAVANLVVGGVNLLPGLPLDGGRVLAAAVQASGAGRLHAIRVAGWGGRVLAVCVAALPLLVALTGRHGVDLAVVVLLAVLGAATWVSAGVAVESASVRARVPTLSVARLTRTAASVSSSTSVSQALVQASAAGAADVVVVDSSGAPVGIATAERLRGVDEARRPWVTVGELARTPGPPIPGDLTGEALLVELRSRPAEAYVVLDPTGGAAGLITTRDVTAVLHGSRTDTDQPAAQQGKDHV